MSCCESFISQVNARSPLCSFINHEFTVTRTSAASPLLLVQKSLAPPLNARTVHAVQTHVLSALCVLAVHAAVDPTLHVFIKSRYVTRRYSAAKLMHRDRKHPYTPHPVLVLLALSQCTVAALYVLRTVMRDVWVFPFRVRLSLSLPEFRLNPTHSVQRLRPPPAQFLHPSFSHSSRCPSRSSPSFWFSRFFGVSRSVCSDTSGGCALISFSILPSPPHPLTARQRPPLPRPRVGAWSPDSGYVGSCCRRLGMEHR